MLMKATVKNYIDGNPILIAPLHTKVIDLLKVNHLELNEIAIINIHNYLIKLDDILNAQVQE